MDKNSRGYLSLNKYSHVSDLNIYKEEVKDFRLHLKQIFKNYEITMKAVDLTLDFFRKKLREETTKDDEDFKAFGYDSSDDDFKYKTRENTTADHNCSTTIIF